MPERRLVLLGVLRGGRDPSHARVNARLQDHVTERLPKPSLPRLRKCHVIKSRPRLESDGPKVLLTWIRCHMIRAAAIGFSTATRDVSRTSDGRPARTGKANMFSGQNQS